MRSWLGYVTMRRGELEEILSSSSRLYTNFVLLSQTWYNNVGNRELYMNCINTELTGGDGSEMNEFPTMFVANMENINSCPTTESVNVQFPYPGKYVTTKTAVKGATSAYPLVKPTGSGCANDGAPSGGVGRSGPAPSPSQSSRHVSPSTAPAYSATGASKMSSAPATFSAPAPLPTAGGSESSSGSCPDSKVPCTSPGSVICIDSGKFGLCDIDNCAVPQPLAAGTHCIGGQVLKKRGLIRHARRHGVYPHGS